MKLNKVEFSNERVMLYRVFLNYVPQMIGELQDFNMSQKGPMNVGPEMLLQKVAEHKISKAHCVARMVQLSWCMILLNVWAAIIGNRLIGPYILPAKFIGPRNLRFLRRHLLRMLGDVSLRTRQRMWPCMMVLQHSSLAVREWLGRHYPGHCIGRGPEAPASWPPRSPDIDSIDFYLWSSIKKFGSRQHCWQQRAT
jgi:hypothetical protein